MTVEKANEGTMLKPPVQTCAIGSKLVSIQGAGLVTNPYNHEGDRLSDFSYAGFYTGEVDLPETKGLKVIETISSIDDPIGDDTARIQSVIDRVAKEHDQDHMVVIKLMPGRYRINENGINLRSGVLLSGSGQGQTGTILYSFANKQHATLKVKGVHEPAIGIKANILDDYVCSGSSRIHIEKEKVSHFSIGDTIVLYHPSSASWLKGMKMDDLQYKYPNSWRPGSVDMQTERTITAIEDNCLVLDFPLFVPFIKEYSQCQIYKLDESYRTTDFGVENMRFESFFNGDPEDEDHANVAVSIAHAKNGFVRNISAKYYVLSAVRCGAGAKQITVQNCSSLEPVSKVAGSRRYSFSTSQHAQQILFTGCYSYKGRHDYMTSYAGTGPIVFADNVADTSYTASETHGTWTTGVLHDNLYHIPEASKGFLAYANRGFYGTTLSQGWSGAGCVAWNCLSTTILGSKPSLNYQNFLIGVFGRYLDSKSMDIKEKNIKSYSNIYRTNTIETGKEEHFKTSSETSLVGDCYIEAPENSVEPFSLFKAQLAQRITGCFRNVKPNAPILVSPKPEDVLFSNNVIIEGICNKEAQNVLIIIDDEFYEAVIDAEKNIFQLVIELKDGYHKIYAVQKVNGVIGTKNADRFITINEVTDHTNYDRLSSEYSLDLTALIEKG